MVQEKIFRIWCQLWYTLNPKETVNSIPPLEYHIQMGLNYVSCGACHTASCGFCIWVYWLCYFPFVPLQFRIPLSNLFYDPGCCYIMDFWILEAEGERVHETMVMDVLGSFSPACGRHLCRNPSSESDPLQFLLSVCCFFIRVSGIGYLYLLTLVSTLFVCVISSLNGTFVSHAPLHSSLLLKWFTLLSMPSCCPDTAGWYSN